jgi:hypothetical protein
MPEDKPEPKPEPKPVEKPSTPPSEEQGNEGKVRGKYVNYQELSKDELVKMLMRVNKRLTRINRELKEIINILYYGNTQAPQEGGGQNSGYRNRRNYGYSKYGGRYGNRQYGYKRNYRRSDEDEDVDYE